MNTREHQLQQVREQAYIAACESCSPNSHEFESLLERLEESYQEPWLRYYDLREDGHNHYAAAVMAGLTDPH